MKNLLVAVQRLLAVLLSSAVIITSLPQAGLSAYAASTDDSVAVDSEIDFFAEDSYDAGEVENVGETTVTDETVSENSASEEVEVNEDAETDEKALDLTVETNIMLSSDQDANEDLSSDEFIFEYNESEVEEILVYDYNGGTQLTLSENSGIDVSVDLNLNIKVKPVKGKGADLKYQCQDEDGEYIITRFLEFQGIDEERYYCYEDLYTGDVIDHKLTIVCYDTCSVTFKKEGEASDDLTITRVYKNYYEEESDEYDWEEIDAIDLDKALSLRIGSEIYFRTNWYDQDEYIETRTITTEGVTSQLEADDWDWNYEAPVYHLTLTGDTTVTINRSLRPKYKLTFEKEGDASDNLNITRVTPRYYNYEEGMWEWEELGKIDLDQALSINVGDDIYFRTNEYYTDECIQTCTFRTGDIKGRLEIYGYDSSWGYPIYHLTPTGDTTVTINRSYRPKYTVTVVRGKYVTGYGAYYGDGELESDGKYIVTEGQDFRIFDIEIGEEAYKASVTYTVEDGEQQEAKAGYEIGDGIYYSITITGDTTININAEPVNTYDVTFDLADEIDGVEIWEAGSEDKSGNKVLDGNKITLSNAKRYFFSISHADGYYIDSIVCTYDDSATEIVLEKSDYYFRYDGDKEYRLFVDCYLLGGAYDIKGDLTVKVNLSAGYTLAFDTSQADAVQLLPVGNAVIDDRSHYIESKEIALPLTADYSFYIDYWYAKQYQYDMSIDSEAFVLTKAYGREFTGHNSDYVYTVTPKKGVELPKKVTVSIIKRDSKSHEITLDYSDETIDNISIQSYTDEGKHNLYSISNKAVTVDSSPLTLTLSPADSYAAEVAIQGESDTEPVTLTPYRNYKGKKEYYIGIVTEDKTITITTSTGVWQEAYYKVGFYPKGAYIMDTVYDTPYISFSYYDDFDSDQYPYYVTKGESISFYVNPYYGYVVEDVYAGGDEVVPEWDDTLWRYVYTVAPDKDTLVTVNTVKKNDSNAPVDPSDPTNPDDPGDSDRTDKTDLEAVLEKYKDVKDIETIKEAYEQAQKVLDNPNATQEDIDNAIAALEKAVQGLGLWIADIPDQTYTGSAIKPDVKVYYGGELLALKSDYTVSYSKNTNAGTATVKVTGKGNYGSWDTAEFTIQKKNLAADDGSIVAADVYAMVSNNGKLTNPDVKVKYGTKSLSKTKDFELIYPDDDKIKKDENGNIITAQYEITIKARPDSNYTGQKTIKYDVLANGTNLISKFTVKLNKTKVDYKGNETEKPGIDSVKKGSTVLTSDDYEISYTDWDKVGKATITLTGKVEKNCYGTKTVTYTVNGTAFKASNIDISGIGGSYPYTGKEITIDTLVVKDKTDNLKTLVSGQDFTVSYTNNKDAGTAKVTITGAGGYTGKITKNFKIDKIDLGQFDVAGSTLKEAIKFTYADKAEYTKIGAQPEMTLSYLDNDLVLKTDYTVSYTNNKKVKPGEQSATLKITGKGNYKGNLTRTFEVISPDIDKIENEGTIYAVATDIAVPKNLSKLKASLKVYEKSTGKTLTSNTDYTTAEQCQYFIMRNGGTWDANIKDTDQADTDLKPDAVIRVRITLKGNYATYADPNKQTPVIETTFRLYDDKKKVSNLTIAKIPEQPYTGDEIKPMLEVRDKKNYEGDGKLLEEGIDYTVSYTNNVKKGTAKATITGCGNGYGGTKTVSFKITAKQMSFNVGNVTQAIANFLQNVFE